MFQDKTEGDVAIAKQRFITVMAIDDHPLFLEGISSVLTAEQGIRIAAEVRTGKQALQGYLETMRDVTLMDIWMPDMAVSKRRRRQADDAGNWTFLCLVSGIQSNKRVGITLANTAET